MATEIFFPNVEPVWEFDRECVRFYAVVNQQTVVCLISAEALYRHFGAPNFEAAEAVAAFKANRPQIENAARRKIAEAGERNIREVLLVMEDFQPTSTTSTTTTPPLRPDQRLQGRVKIQLHGDAASNPHLEHLARSATDILAKEIVHGPVIVTAAWTGMNSNVGLLLYVRLVDEDTKAAAENLFTDHDLENVSVARFALFRLYDDLLRAKGAVLMERYLKGESAGGKS